MREMRSTKSNPLFKSITAGAIVLIFVATMMFAFSGCAIIDYVVGGVKENIIGRNLTITTYDNFANPTSQISGTKVNIGLLTNDANFEGGEGFESEVLEITVNGNQMFQVGDTLIIEEDGLERVDDFEIPESVDVFHGGGLIPIDRMVNQFSNYIGKKKVIVIKTSLGIPISVYQGNEVYVSVPANLPKTTLLSVDGKALYIHRANYSIFDADMLKES